MKKIKKFKIRQGMMFFDRSSQEHLIVMQVAYNCKLYSVEKQVYSTMTSEEMIWKMNQRTLELKVTSDGKVT